MSQLLTRTVPLLRQQLRVDENGQPVRDRYQNDVYDEVTLQVPDCTWEPREAPGSDAEDTDRRQLVISGLVLYCANPAVDIRPTDALLIDSKRWEVDGEIGRYSGGRMGTDHAVVPLRRTAG